MGSGQLPYTTNTEAPIQQQRATLIIDHLMNWHIIAAVGLTLCSGCAGISRTPGGDQGSSYAPGPNQKESQGVDGSSAPVAPSEPARVARDTIMREWKHMLRVVGLKMDTLIADYGLPDSVESSANYSTLFESGTASIVFNYESTRLRVFVARDCRILGVVPMDLHDW